MTFFNDIHNSNNVNQDDFIIPKFKKVLGCKNIRKIGLSIWNSLDKYMILHIVQYACFQNYNLCV